MATIKSKIKKIFDTIDLQEYFIPVLSYISELCEVPYLFVSLMGTEGLKVKSGVGLDILDLPEPTLLLNEEVFQNNKITIVNTIEKDVSVKVSTSNSFDFFIGYPICIDEKIVVGTLCIMDHSIKELTSQQLIFLEQAVFQIQTVLKLHIQTAKLGLLAGQQADQLQQFIDNSQEIYFEVSLEGIITHASASWTRFLGYDLINVLGRDKVEFLHPEDFEKFRAALRKVRAGEQFEEKLVYRILHQDGYYLWHSSRLKFVERAGIPFYSGNSTDITDSVIAQQNFLQQKEFYEEILDRLPIDVAVFDRNYKYTYLNPAAIENEALRKFIIGKDDFEYAKHTGRDDEFAKNRRIKFLQALESRNLMEWEDTIQGQNGEMICHTRKFAPVFHADGSFEMMIGFGVDITESKKNQDEILRSRQLTSSIIENVAVGILVQGPQSEILENNLAACEMLGLSEDQLLGKTSFDEHWKVIHLDGSEFLSEDHPVPQAIQHLKPINNVVMGVHRPVLNDLVWLLVDAIPVFGDSDELLYVICSFNDITAQKKAEDSLKISNERFSYSNKATSDAVWDWNIMTDEIFLGESFSILFGHQFGNNIITRQLCESFIHPEDREAYFKSIEECVNNFVYRWSAEYRYLKSDGFYSYVKDKAVIIRNEAGKAVRIIGAMQDITKEKLLKDQLQQSEEQFKGVFENSAVGMALVDIKGFYIEVNDRLCEMFGYTSQEMKLLKFQEITHQEDLVLDLDNKRKLDSGKIDRVSSEKRFIHKNKSIVWTNIFVSLTKNNKNEIKHYIVQIIDITERKKIENENRLLIEENSRNKTLQLNEARNMYRLLAENTADLVCLHNLDTTFRYVSPSIQKLLGYSPEELLGQSPLEYAHPEDLEALIQEFQDFMTQKKDEAVEFKFRTKAGNYILLEIKATLIIENGITTGFHSSTRDITIRKESEQLIEKALIQERELNELRTNLVSTISHEFRTPMTTIRTSAELISMYLEGQNFENSIQIEKRVYTITREIDRIVELMNAVLTISKEEAGKTNFNPIAFDLKQVCLDVIDSSYGNYDDKRKVQTSFEGDSFYIFADKNLVEYCIFNILNNAFKYSKGFGDIIFRVFKREPAIVIEIIDFGIGIPEQDQSKLFNTFFRASNTDGFQGTGLGLYIVKTFAEKNSGTVHLESIEGKGTKVTLQFPLQN